MFQVRLTDEARAGIDAYCTRRHITQTAWLEAFGQLARRGDPDDEAVVELARRIDRERRSRQ